MISIDRVKDAWSVLRGRETIERIAQPLLVQETIALPVKIFTRGKWVTANGQVGIIVDLGVFNKAGIDFVDEQGLTEYCDYVPLGSVQLAKRSEIPAPRRPSIEDGIALGYIN